MRHGSVWLSFTVLWAAYGLMFTGYAWLRGYNISFPEIWSPVNYYQGSKLSDAGLFSGTGVFPTGKVSSPSGGASLGTAAQRLTIALQTAPLGNIIQNPPGTSVNNLQRITGQGPTAGG